MATCEKVWITTTGLTDTPMDRAMRDARAALFETRPLMKWNLPHLYVEEEVKEYICHGKKTAQEIIEETINQATKEKEKIEMGEKKYNEMFKRAEQNGDIIWRVNDISISRDTLSRDIVPRVDIEARLVGIPKANSGCPFDTAKMRYDLQNALESRAGLPMVKRVIFNKPATIIVWADGTKTVVKRQKGDRWDPEKGFAMAYLKKLLGNDNTFNKEIAKWVKEEQPNEN